MSQDNSQTPAQPEPHRPSQDPASKRSPWAWVPTLYLAEGLPYVLVMTVSTIMYTRLGVSLAEIGFWTSILGFAWVIKPLWGPLVDLYWTKRRWSVLMQILMGILLGVVALTLQGPWWWSGSLLALGVVALFSATHDIAADGFYMDALNEKQQSFFVGIRSTFYRLAMIFGQGVLLIIAGMIEQRTGPVPAHIDVAAAPDAVVGVAPAANPDDSAFVKFEPAGIALSPGAETTVSVTLAQAPEDEQTVTLRREASSFLTELFPFGAEQQVELADRKYEVLKFDETNWNVPQEIVFTADANLKESIVVPFKATSGNISLTWAICFGGIGALMFAFGIFHLFALPRPPTDHAALKPETPFAVAALVMAGVVALPVAIYMVFYYGIFGVLESAAVARWGETLPFSKTVLTFITIGIMALLAVVLFQIREFRRVAALPFSGAARISNVPFDEVFRSFFAKPGIAKMLAFLMVYRLGEALLVKMSGPFLIKPVAEGGIGLSSAEYGLAYGTFGIAAMTLGGILGGLAASRGGLKRWLLPMCAAINIPDLFYVYLAYVQPPEYWKVVAAVAGESFGYGFGFTAYMLYMLYIAGTGEHKTSHFALCTGFMALGMMLPGMVSGDLAEMLGWPIFFVVVCVATIPGFLMLPVIPLDREFGRRSE